MRKIIRHELVTVNIPANSTLTRFNMPDLPNLRNVHLLGLQVYTVDEVAVDIISRNPVCSHTVVLHQSYLTLVNYGGKEFLKQSPAITYNTINQALGTGLTATNWNEQDIKSFIGQKVNYPKSFIEFTTPPALAVDTAYIFSVYYSLPIEEEKKESGFSFNAKG
jgi:hypothetical protein